jgi:DNA-binding IclR family transcriptional regulator
MHMSSESETLKDWAEAGVVIGHEELVRDGSVSTTLIRGLEVLSCFRTAGETLSNADIARRLGLNRPAVSRLCKTLISQGFIRRDKNGTFRLAPKILTLAYPVLAAARWRHSAAGLMRDVAEFTSGNVTLAVVSGGDFVSVQTAGEARNFPHVPEIGISGPLVASATGRALLSLLSGQEFSDTLALSRLAYPELFGRFASHTVASIERCRSDEGFCVSYGDWRPSIYAASAPLGFTEDGLPVTLTCALPSYRTRREDMEEDVGPRLHQAANTLRQMGLFTLLPPS